jgi:small subunit ribosomal protein S6
MLILPAEADEAMVGTAVDRIAKIVTPAGGEVGELDRWGRKRFAYEIAHQNEGYYVVVRFTAEPSVQSELERTLKLADEVIRHKIMLLPDRAVQKRPPKAPAKAPAKAAATASPASE